MNERELLRWMDKSQRIEWKLARAKGGDTFLRLGAPDCGSDGLFHPYYCDDCEKWHKQWTGVCFDVMDGEVWAFDWTCDDDGDWSYDPRCKLRAYNEQMMRQDYEDACKAADEYEREEGV